RFLFIVQGEGRGHLTQAISLAGMLRRHGHEVLETLVGKSQTRDLPRFFSEKIHSPLRIYDAPSMVFKKDRKHIDLIKTFIHNVSPRKLAKYAQSVELIHSRIKELAPDRVINFYEMLPSFVQLRSRIDVPFVHIGHQYLLRHPDYPHGRGDHMILLRLYTTLCSLGASRILALSFYPMKSYARDRVVVVPPLLRKEVLNLTPTEGSHILGYMLNSGYEQEIRAWHKTHPKERLHFFWDGRHVPPVWKVDKTLTLHTIDDASFLKYMASCRGYVTTAGFESVCEALYLDKPVMMIPAHIEQEVNAADALSIHGGVIGDSFDLTKLLQHITQEKRAFDAAAFQEWVRSAEQIFIEQLTSTLP
ncbi:MAG: glycosyltransferase, partial [Tannerella sp.]|nr:glycosyltransferase [Tannerella sp.]